MNYKASTTVNEPKAVKRRLLVKSILLAIVIVMCLPLLRTPTDFTRDNRSEWRYGEFLYEGKITPDSYAGFFAWYDGQFTCDLVRHEWLRYEYMDTIFGDWPGRNWRVNRDFESQGKVYNITYGFLPEGSARSNDEGITYIETDYGGALYFTVTGKSPA